MKEIFRKSIVVFITALVLLGFARTSIAAEEERVTGEVAASFLSAYIWRGQELTRQSAVIQPSLTVGYKGFTINFWENMDTKPYSTGDEKYSSNFTETDLTFFYSHKFGILQVGAGYIYYALAAPYAGTADPLDSQELFITLGLDTILAPTLTVYKEIDHYHQWYVLLGVSHTFTLHEKIGLKLAATASYLKSEDATTYAKYDSNSAATADKFNNFHDATVSVSLPVSVTKYLTITPVIIYVFPLSDDARYEMRGRGLKIAANPSDRDSAFLYGGFSASFTF
ncbi:MAG: hypothetical protein NTW65_12590 [Deltaproteobacteria bacterium]|nr:hypothetical protein [Deltaproteobacteria bacterium]